MNISDGKAIVGTAPLVLSILSFIHCVRAKDENAYRMSGVACGEQCVSLTVCSMQSVVVCRVLKAMECSA